MTHRQLITLALAYVGTLLMLIAIPFDVATPAVELFVLLANLAVAWLVVSTLGRLAHKLNRRVRLRLRRTDTGDVYLDRWGVEWKRLGGVFVHRMRAPDPGRDLHDHPWAFVSLILAGGYVERRADARSPLSEHNEVRRRFSLRVMRLDEVHTITRLVGASSWSLVIHGPKVRPWGYYVPHPAAVDRWTWVERQKYEELFDGTRRGLTAELRSW